MEKTKFEMPRPETLYWSEEGKMMLTMGDMLNAIDEIEFVPRDATDLGWLLWCYDATPTSAEQPY